MLWEAHEKWVSHNFFMAGKEVNYGKKSSSRNVGRRGFFRCSIFIKEARVRCDRCHYADLAGRGWIYTGKKSKALPAGEALTKDDLTSCTVKLPRSQSILYASDSKNLIGQYAKTALKKGQLLTADFFYSDERLTERNRYLELSDIRLPESVHTNNLIDIRISFPTGEDYIVLNQQRVLSLLKEDEGTSVCGIALNLSEEDLLRLSSARVDENLFEGTYLYAVIYQADFENAAVTTYPVNPQVFTLMQWDPNIVSLFTVKKEQEKRSVLENHLQLFTQKEMGNSIEAELESLPDSQEELPEQDNNISQM